jgi:hypothetical protein
MQQPPRGGPTAAELTASPPADIARPPTLGRDDLNDRSGYTPLDLLDGSPNALDASVGVAQDGLGLKQPRDPGGHQPRISQSALMRLDVQRILPWTLTNTRTTVGRGSVSWLYARPESFKDGLRGCVLRPLCAGASRKHPPSKETTGKRSRRSTPVQWAWLDLNQRPHPEKKIARLPTGSAAREPELGRHARFSSLVAAPGHGGLIRYRGLSAVRTAVFPGRWRP